MADTTETEYPTQDPFAEYPDGLPISGLFLPRDDDYQVTIAGNLTSDPELRFSPKGTAVCTFSVAANEPKKDGDVQFFDVVCFQNMAEDAAQSLTKGSRVIVFGNLELRPKEELGQYWHKVIANEVGASLKWNNVSIDRPVRKTQPTAPVKATPAKRAAKRAPR